MSLQYESKLVQEICQAEDVDTAIKTWLLEQSSRLPNTVILLAGRPHPQLQDAFKQKFTEAEWVFEPLDLDTLKREETWDYLAVMREQRPELVEILTPEVQAQIYQITQGRPIYLTLLIDLLLHEGVLSDIFPVVAEAAGALDEKLVGQRLVERLLGLPHAFGEMLYFLVRARKGLDAELLRYLVGDRWSVEQIQNNLARMREFAFVKTRPQTQSLFLHDEVYDLFDRYFRGDPSYSREYAPIARYYQQVLEEATSPQEREVVMVTLLYYELQINPSVGYHRYFARWDEDAIKSHEIGLDMRLCDEVLRFLNRYAIPGALLYDQSVAEQIDHAAIERDSALRWVKRFLARGNVDKARQVAEALYISKEAAFDWQKVTDPIYKADLLRVWGEILVLSSAPEEVARQHLEQALDLLENGHNWTEDEQWWQTRIMGQAHNYLGYLHRVRGRHGLALEQYKRALPYFQKADIQIERANTLNNLAFLLAQLGRVTLALNHVEQSLEIRRKLGRQYPIALSINTLGLIHTLQAHPTWGEGECREALHICENLQEQRGMGLAQIGLGFALRKRGDQWKLGVYSPVQAEQFFGEAAPYLTSAVDLFSKKFDEPVRLWEAYNELGSLYCDWGWLVRNQSDWQTALDCYRRSIEYQQKALQVAQEYKLQFQIADSYDDFAQIYGDQSFLLIEMNTLAEAQESRKRSESYLKRIEQMVPAGFRLIQGEGFQEPLEPGEAYWLALGKVHLRRGMWAFRDVEVSSMLEQERQEYLTKAIREFSLAAIYFQHYWPQSFALEHMLDRFSRFLQRANVPSDWAIEQVGKVAEEYNFNLTVVETAISDVLGL